jgi:hypothetical protein
MLVFLFFYFPFSFTLSIFLQCDLNDWICITLDKSFPKAIKNIHLYFSCNFLRAERKLYEHLSMQTS